MTPLERQKQRLFSAMQKREEERYSLIKHLLLLASASLSVMVTLHRDSNSTGISLLFLRVAWVGLGLGILLGGIRLYGSVWFQSEMVKGIALVVSKIQLNHDAQSDVSTEVTVEMKGWHKSSEAGCYICLICAVFGLVSHSLIRDSSPKRESIQQVYTNMVRFPDFFEQREKPTKTN